MTISALKMLVAFCRSLLIVLMLHGPSGVGKNHISRLLARSMFTNGVDSRFVNYYSSSRHFREADKVEEYRRTLDHEIKSNLTVCDNQLFIFDEARRFPPKLLDSLAPFFDPGMKYYLYISFIRTIILRPFTDFLTNLL